LGIQFEGRFAKVFPFCMVIFSPKKTMRISGMNPAKQLAHYLAFKDGWELW
jgi:hypothetical protein